jgi:hypothetical protein
MEAEHLNQIAEAIESRGRADFPGSYTGLWVDRLDERFIVFRGDDSRVDAALREAFPEAQISFRRGGHDPRVLEQIRASIEDDRDFWRRQGVEISVLGVLPDGQGVTVGTPRADTATDALEERYGAEYVIVERATFGFFPPLRRPAPPDQLT